MNTEKFNQKILPSLKSFLAINFNAAVIFLFIVSVISVTGSSFFFDNNSDLYGPMANNLRLMLIFLTLSQLGVYCFCSYQQNYRFLLPVGLFWLLLMGSITFYGMVNQILIDDDYRWFFLYMAVSNLAYGGLHMANNKYLRQDINNSPSKNDRGRG